MSTRSSPRQQFESSRAAKKMLVAFLVRVRSCFQRKVAQWLSLFVSSRSGAQSPNAPRGDTAPIPMPQIFTEIFERNIWLGDESRSGLGSGIVQTEIVRRALPELVRKFAVRSMLDVPCGDFNWMKSVDLDLIYIGCDIVPAV